jgi:hypothetical protein
MREPDPELGSALAPIRQLDPKLDDLDPVLDPKLDPLRTFLRSENF